MGSVCVGSQMEVILTHIIMKPSISPPVEKDQVVETTTSHRRAESSVSSDTSSTIDKRTDSYGGSTASVTSESRHTASSSVSSIDKEKGHTGSASSDLEAQDEADEYSQKRFGFV